MMNGQHYLSFTIGLFAFFIFSSVQAQEATMKEDKDTSKTTAFVTADDATNVFEKTEVAATIDKTLWRKHLESHLGEPIINAMKDGMQPGKYTVNVRFIVEKDGSIADVKALNDPGYGLAASAVKVVRTGPKWTAAEQGGKKVRSYHTQPVTFLIQQTKYIQM